MPWAHEIRLLLWIETIQKASLLVSWVILYHYPTLFGHCYNYFKVGYHLILSIRIFVAQNLPFCIVNGHPQKSSVWNINTVNSCYVHPLWRPKGFTGAILFHFLMLLPPSEWQTSPPHFPHTEIIQRGLSCLGWSRGYSWEVRPEFPDPLAQQILLLHFSRW